MKRAILSALVLAALALTAAAPPPHIDSISPATAAIFDDLTINGSGFGDKQGTSKVTLGGQKTPVAAWSDTQVKINVPKITLGDRNVVVTVGGVASNAIVLHVTP